jgi:membrane protein implicated in regulation of membrane protease activity
MGGFDPRFIALLSLVFIGVGIYNIVRGRKRMLLVRAQGVSLAWYKQPNILMGIEYIMLAVAFLLSIGIAYHWLPASLSGITLPLYYGVLLFSAILASVVILQGITNTRRRRAMQQAPAETYPPRRAPAVSAEQRAATLKKRRERRRRAAEDRRHRAGKA